VTRQQLVRLARPLAALAAAAVLTVGLTQSTTTAAFTAQTGDTGNQSANAVARSLIKFTLKGKPAGCVVASAVLTLRVSNGTAGSTIQVFRAAAAWDPTTVDWTSDPGIIAGSATSAASAANGFLVQWNVATQVTALYAGPDYGFEIRDAAEGVGNNTQLFDSMESTTVANRPQLDITWG
jgi:hypothetical protein